MPRVTSTPPVSHTAAYLLGLICLIATGAASSGAARAAPSYTSAASGGLAAQPILGFPATGATVIGASTTDGANGGEVWAEGRIGKVPATLADGSGLADSEVLVRRTDARRNWQVEPVRDAAGVSLATGWSAAAVTAAGAVVLAGITAPADAPPDPEQILTRAPDATAFAAVAEVPAAELKPGETLSSTSTEGPPILAATDEEGGTGLFVAPSKPSTAAPGILHYAGASATWQREPICATDTAAECTPPTAPIDVVAISASSPSNAWMVATPTDATGAAATPQLYQRVPATGGATGSVWLAQTVASPLLDPAAGLVLPGAGAEPGTNSGAILTASGSGVWLDLVKAGPTGGDGSEGSATLFYAAGKAGGSWCSAGISCPEGTGTLPAGLPPGYGSTATVPANDSSPGGRAITGLPHGAMMVLDLGASSFAYRITAGGESEANGTVTPDYSGGNTVGPGGVSVAPFLREGEAGVGGGAAFTSPTDAWLGVGGPTPGPQVVHLTSSPTPSALHSWPVPAARPLLAIAGQPGTNAAAGEGEAIAVGDGGQVLRFHPGGGWIPEMVNFQGGLVGFPVVALRGVAWPSPEAAYVVGDAGQIFRWAPSSGWESDPGAPAGLTANLTAVAFSASDPNVGYAVGKGGTLLSFAGGTWQPQAPPPGLENANFSAVTFAAGEAIAAYRQPSGGTETGGLIVNDGSGWQADPTLPGLLVKAGVEDPVITDVAGLPDGGAVAAGPGVVVERDNSSSPWRFPTVPLGELEGGGVSALAATRDESGQIRAIVSVDPDPSEAPNGSASVWGAADAASQPDPLPNLGFVVRETADGWVDTQLEDFPGVVEPSGPAIDQPGWPDGVYALLVDSSGTSGWAVGGQTGGTQAALPQDGASPAEESDFYASQGGSAARFGSGPTPPTGTSSPLPSVLNETGAPETPVGQTFAIGGGGGCNAPCSDAAQGLLGPNADLAEAISTAGQIPGLGAFIYAGRAVGWEAGPEDGGEAFARELTQYAGVLSSAGSGPPVYAVPNGSPSGGDIQSADDEELYRAALGAHVQSSVGPTPPDGTSAYAFVSHGAGDPARVITLDFSQGNTASNQESWLVAELAEAKRAGEPTLVVGADNITDPDASNYAGDAGAIVSALAAGDASGYVYNRPDRTNYLEGFGPANELTAVGVGTLGYTNAGGNFTSNPGLMVVSISTDPKYAFKSGRPALLVQGQVPVIGSAAISVPSRRTVKVGEAVSFGGLALRAQGGAGGVGTRLRSFPVPASGCSLDINCQVYPRVAFSTSDPVVGKFVAAASPGEPGVPGIDPKSGKTFDYTGAGLFCALSPGTTTVGFITGGKTYSETITVEEGPPGGPCPVPGPAETVPKPAAAEPAPAETASEPAPKRPAPVHQHPVVKHHPHSKPKPAPDRPEPAQSRPEPAPTSPAEGPPAQPAPSSSPPKSPPITSGGGPQPVPPTGVSNAPAPVGANAPASSTANVPANSPTTVPLQVPALERRSSAEVGFERAEHHFAAYRPDDGPAALPAAALLLLVLSAGGSAGIAVGMRRSRQRTAPSTRGGTRMALSRPSPRDDRRARR